MKYIDSFIYKNIITYLSSYYYVMKIQNNVGYNHADSISYIQFKHIKDKHLPDYIFRFIDTLNEEENKKGKKLRTKLISYEKVENDELFLQVPISVPMCFYNKSYVLDSNKTEHCILCNDIKPIGADDFIIDMTSWFSKKIDECLVYFNRSPETSSLVDLTERMTVAGYSVELINGDELSLIMDVENSKLHLLSIITNGDIVFEHSYPFHKFRLFNYNVKYLNRSEEPSLKPGFSRIIISRKINQKIKQETLVELLKSPDTRDLMKEHFKNNPLSLIDDDEIEESCNTIKQ